MRKKNFAALLLVFCMALSLCIFECDPAAGGVRFLAEEIEDRDQTPAGPNIMDILYYAKSEMTFGDLSPSKDCKVRDFKGSASDFEVIKAYVNLLCSKFDYTLVGEPFYKSYPKTTFFDFVLRYTGSSALKGDKVYGTFSKNEGDVMIYGNIERDRLKGALWFNRRITPYDAGYSYGGEWNSASVSLVGDSVYEGLFQSSDGSFQTADERLTVKLGQATVLADGKVSTFNARFVTDLDSSQQQFLVENSKGVIQLKCYFPITLTFETGDIYKEDYFTIESDYAQKTEFQKRTKMFAYTWPCMFAQLHDGGYVIPIRGMAGEMNRLNVRIMYCDENIAVVYACAQYDCKPYEVEVLMAVSVGDETVSANKPDAVYSVSRGETINITGPSLFGAHVNMWTWEFLEGSNLAELTGTIAQTCSLKTYKYGDVRLKVTYNYSVYEPDVLTKNPRSVEKAQTMEYVIHIVQ